MAVSPALMDHGIAVVLGPYAIIDEATVREFLAQRPALSRVLAEAPARIARLFDPGYSLRLEVFRDPESPDNSELQLLIVSCIETEAEWEEADRRVHTLYESWLESLPRAVTSDFLVRAEPR